MAKSEKKDKKKKEKQEDDGPAADPSAETEDVEMVEVEESKVRLDPTAHGYVLTGLPLRLEQKSEEG